MVDLYIPNDPEWQWAYNAILYTSGEEWPQANEGALRAFNEEINSFAAQLNSAAAGVNGLSSNVFNVLKGDTARAFFNSTKNVMDGIPENMELANGLGGQALSFALDTEQTKYTVIIAMISQVLEIAMAIMSGFAFMVPFQIEIGGAIVRALLRLMKLRRLAEAGRIGRVGATKSMEQALKEATSLKALFQAMKNGEDGLKVPIALKIGLEGIEEAGQEAMENILAQAIQFFEGNRKTFDAKGVGLDMLMGFLIGLNAGALKGIGNKVAPGFTHSALGHGAIEAGAELPVEAIASMILGGNFNPLATAVSGLAGGIASKKAHDIGHAIGDHGAGGPGPNLPTGLGTDGPAADINVTDGPSNLGPAGPGPADQGASHQGFDQPPPAAGGGGDSHGSGNPAPNGTATPTPSPTGAPAPAGSPTPSPAGNGQNAPTGTPPPAGSQATSPTANPAPTGNQTPTGTSTPAGSQAPTGTSTPAGGQAPTGAPAPTPTGSQPSTGQQPPADQLTPSGQQNLGNQQALGGHQAPPGNQGSAPTPSPASGNAPTGSNAPTGA
ncbi:MAG TPA: hypothetical protein VGP57_24095, partial [Actinoplanes sp.]|nr:hypothetical protein [Actinoplanes sp.]